MKLYRLRDRILAEVHGRFVRANLSWDDMFRSDDPESAIARAISNGAAESAFSPEELLPPVGDQEVWAAGVTYVRSRAARMEESHATGGSDFYAQVYEADRPELFFKAAAHRVVGSGGAVRIRRDARWSVPEPELVLAISARGRVFGYTIGNDMTSRDIEAENPLYLPQAKIYDGSCALGPGLFIAPEPSQSTTIGLRVTRAGHDVFEGQTTLASLRRTSASLVDYLFRETSFPQGVFLMTGTGIVPPTSFTLQAGDEIQIDIDGIGRLTNRVAEA